MRQSYLKELDRENSRQVMLACKLKYSYFNNRASIKRVYDHIKGNSRGFTAFWNRIISDCDVEMVVDGHKLYNSEQLYTVFINEPWAARYIEKQNLPTWEELVAYVEEREEYAKDKIRNLLYG